MRVIFLEKNLLYFSHTYLRIEKQRRKKLNAHYCSQVTFYSVVRRPCVFFKILYHDSEYQSVEVTYDLSRILIRNLLILIAFI